MSERFKKERKAVKLRKKEANFKREQTSIQIKVAKQTIDNMNFTILLYSISIYIFLTIRPYEIFFFSRYPYLFQNLPTFSNLALAQCLVKIIIISLSMQLYSEQQSDSVVLKIEKPKNRNKFNHKGLHFSSDFSGGNLKSASIQNQIIIQNKQALIIQFWGNSDWNSDSKDKTWFCFNLSGIRDSRTMKYSYLLFRYKNANVYRKFIKQKKYKPYIVVRQHREKTGGQWKVIPISKINQPVDNQDIQAQFIYVIQPGIDKATFALNLCYGLADFDSLNRRMIQQLETKRNSLVYYHRQIMAESVDYHPVYMLTITSSDNIASYTNYESEIWPHKGQRPYMLKNKPEIVITGRVHPSETSSSFCIEGIIQNLVTNRNLEPLLSMFIFRIIPIINPDGVQNGHYRLDNYLQNLNRFYGHSNVQKTPSVFAVEKLIVHLRDNSKLFLFTDIHGHNSPKPSFIFGNYTSHFLQAIENRVFVKIFQLIAGQNKFSSLDCDFSKRNMSVKEKYDEHSKQASARVFAFQGVYSSENSVVRPQLMVEHSYTLQVHPYCIAKGEKKQGIQNNELQINTQTLQWQSPSFAQIIREYKSIGQYFLVSIMEMVGANFSCPLPDIEELKILRKKCAREISRQIQFYDRTKRQKDKDVNRQAYEKYYKNWGICESFKQYVDKNQDKLASFKQKIKQCPIYQSIEDQGIKKSSSMTKIDARRIQNSPSPTKQKQKQLSSKLEILIPNIGASTQIKKRIIQIDSKRLIEQYQNQNQNSNEGESVQKYQMKKQQKMSEGQIGNLYNYIEMKMFQRAEKYYKNFNIQNHAVLKNYSPTFNAENKNKFSDKQSIGELEKRAKRLLFRHKTEMQTKEPIKRVKNKYVIKFDLGILPLDKSFQQDQRKSPQIEVPFSKNIEIMRKIKSKETKMKTEAAKDQKHNLNEILFKNRKNSQKQKTSDLKARVVSTQNPKIRELLKRVSMSKNENNMANMQGIEESMPIGRIKGTKTMLSNLILLKSKKKNGMKGLQFGQRQDIIHSLSNNNCMIYDTNNSLIPLMHHSKIYDDLNDESFSNNLTGLQGSYRSVSPLPKKQEVRGKQQQQSNQVLSLQTLRKNNIQYLEKVKNELMQKKKIFKTVQN